MKKAFALLLAAIMVISLVGCGSNASPSENANAQTNSETATTQAPTEKTEGASNSESTTSVPETTPEAVEPIDLTGLWVQEESDNKTYMAATIREDGKIGVFFVLEGDDTPWTYWVGTYEVPADGKDEFSWVSENTYDGNGLMASSDDTKEFTYKDDKISYPITIQGQSGTLTLVRGEWDTSKIPESVFVAEKSDKADFKNVEIADSGWYLKNNEWLYYYVVLHNPNEKIAVEFPSFRITARDANGVLLGTEDQTLSIIYPGQDFVFGSQAFSVDEMPDKVEFEMLDAEDYNLKNVSVLDEFKPLEVVNAGVKSEKLLGEVKNPNDYDIDTVAVVAICKNAAGEIIGIENTYVDNVKAGSTTPFSTSVYLKESVESVECYANQW